MKRYRYKLVSNTIIDTETNKQFCVICAESQKDFHSLNEMIELANFGYQEYLDNKAFFAQQKKIYDKGGHVGGMSDF